MEEKQDTRKLINFKRILGHYCIAGAICSYGDVIDFVDGEKQGIFIADTCGHREESGIEMSKFIKRKIKSGWGIKGDAEQNLYSLGKELASLRDPNIRPIYSDEWFDFVSASYTQFDRENISLAMGGGLGHTLIFRKDGSLERILMAGGTIDDNDHYLKKHEPAYNTKLKKDEILFLQSDGMHNMAKALHFDSLDGKIDLDTRNTVWYADTLLYNVINKNFYEPAVIIRDAIVSELSKYFLPRTSRDDDVTFVVVK